MHLLRQTIEMCPEVTVASEMSRHLAQLSCADILVRFAQEMAWREDNRRIPNGMQWGWITKAALRHPKSEVWRGYWQRDAA